MQQQEERLQARRASLHAAIEEGGRHTSEQVAAAVEAALDEDELAENRR